MLRFDRLFNIFWWERSWQIKIAIIAYRLLFSVRRLYVLCRAFVLLCTLMVLDLTPQTPPLRIVATAAVVLIHLLVDVTIVSYVALVVVIIGIN